VGRRLKRIIFIALAVFIAIQVVRPARTNPASDPAKAITKRLAVPADVQAIFDRSCRNCHSHETVWPWYSNVAPISWDVINHVNDGRGSMNFSDWPAGPEEAGDLLDSICDEVKKGHMPIPRYTWLHGEARLTDADRKRLCAWSSKAASDLY
jgi:Haem-binding domain